MPIAELFNMTITAGTVPRQWKVAVTHYADTKGNQANALNAAKRLQANFNNSGFVANT